MLHGHGRGRLKTPPVTDGAHTSSDLPIQTEQLRQQWPSYLAQTIRVYAPVRPKNSIASSNRSSPQKISAPIEKLGTPKIPKFRASCVFASYAACAPPKALSVLETFRPISPRVFSKFAREPASSPSKNQYL